MNDGDILIELAFEGRVIHWRGPSPYLFVVIPDAHTIAIRDAARRASYGWGCLPLEAEVNGVPFTTALFPKDGAYMLPLKAAVRKANGVSLGDEVTATITIRARR